VKQDAGRACQVFCVSQLGFWLQVGVDSVGVDEGQLGEGLFPAGGDLTFDETSFGFAFGAASEACFLGAVTGPLCLRWCNGQPQQFDHVVVGKWPRF
jgi:hypothetical protein